MRQILITIFCLGLCGLSLACNSTQENIVAASSDQNAPLAQSTVETIQTPEPTPSPSPLTEKDLKRRAEVHKLMLKGEYLHDGAEELLYIGDISSVPALLVVLKKNPPYPNGMMVCTTAHALQALRKVTSANPGKTYEDWSAWWEKYQ
ncbi:MAG: hypothetical protein H7Z37_06950 [Pyrinomonadaceae bacterium]|nr:hypothetical protein [Pyrinomonadaceae bacterium]